MKSIYLSDSMAFIPYIGFRMKSFSNANAKLP